MIIYLCIRICYYEYALWNVSTIKMHLNCRKDRIQSPTRKEGWDLFERTSDDSSRNNPKWRIIWWEFKRPRHTLVMWHCWVTSLRQILPVMKKYPRRKGRRVPVQEEWCLGCGICKFQHVVDGNIVVYKAIFVAWGLSQKEGIDYEETFAATGS